MKTMKGFAYEKPPLSIRDQLKQRRRWIVGSFEVLGRREVPLRKRAPIVYSVVSWFSALPSIAITIANIIYPTSGLIPLISGVFTGLVWWSIINGYLIGLELHREYTNVNKGIFGIIKGILKGLAVDAIAPWYALFFKTNGYDEISKDEPSDISEKHEADPIISLTSDDVYEFDESHNG